MEDHDEAGAELTIDVPGPLPESSPTLEPPAPTPSRVAQGLDGRRRPLWTGPYATLNTSTTPWGTSSDKGDVTMTTASPGRDTPGLEGRLAVAVTPESGRITNGPSLPIAPRYAAGGVASEAAADDKAGHLSSRPPRKPRDGTRDGPPSRRACLKCGSLTHSVRQCPGITSDEVEKLLAARTPLGKSESNPGAKRVQVVREGDAGADTTSSRTTVGAGSMVDDDGTARATIDGFTLQASLLDSGADDSVVSCGIVRALEAAGLTINQYPMSKTLEPVGGHLIRDVRKVRFGEVEFETSAGPLLLRNLDCLAHEELSLTIGRPVMSRLGCSTDGLLAVARTRQPEYELLDTEQVTPNLSALLQAMRARALEKEGDDSDEEDDLVASPSLEEETTRAVQEALGLKLKEAAANGLPSYEGEQLRDLLFRYVDVFRLSFGNYPPVRVPPLQVRLKEGARAVKDKARRYPPDHKRYLKQHIQELVRHGLVVENHRSRWASAPRIVVKKQPGEFRMIVDTRAVNALTEPMPWPMPDMESDLAMVEESDSYFTIDRWRGYWQLPLDEDSQELYTIMTHRGMFTPTRVLMGCTDAVGFCQGVAEMIFGPLLSGRILAWLDDILGIGQRQGSFAQDGYPRAPEAGLGGVSIFRCQSDSLWRRCHSNSAEDVGLPVHEQRHHPLAFLSGSFTGGMLRWSTIDKDVYAIVISCKRLLYLLLRPRGFRIFTDHRNLQYVFDPLAVNSSLGRHQVDRLQRWAMTLTTFHYAIEHTMERMLSEKFEWPTLSDDIRKFVRGCLHCMVVGERVILRPFGKALRASSPNEVLRFDVLSLPASTTGAQYVLVLKDDMSGFCKLIVCEDPTAESACRCLIDWFMRFGPVPQWVSDRGTHFKNKLLGLLRKCYGSAHHFTTAYCPWSNGSVEVVNRVLLKCLRAMLSELKLHLSNWSTVLPLVSSALSQTPSDRLGGVAPVTAFTALPASPPVVAILHPQTDEVFDVQVVYRKQRQHVDSDQAALEGPRRVVGTINDHIFQVQDLSVPFHVATHHASRLRLYAEADREVTEDLVAQAMHGDGGHLVAKVLECRLGQESHVWEILVEWIGLDPLEASWEPAAIMYEDVPQLVETFVKDQAADSFAHVMWTSLLQDRPVPKAKTKSTRKESSSTRGQPGGRRRKQNGFIGSNGRSDIQPPRSPSVRVVSTITSCYRHNDEHDCADEPHPELYPSIGTGFEYFLKEYEHAIHMESLVNGSTWSDKLKASVLVNFLVGKASRYYHKKCAEWKHKHSGNSMSFVQLKSTMLSEFGCRLTQLELSDRINATNALAGDTCSDNLDYLKYIEGLMDGDQSLLLLQVFCSNSCMQIAPVILSSVDIGSADKSRKQIKL
ncbi:unnamed protein product [Phytophthora fragariaefolia]|uniref:Unnamed protein product n=1 Tax=Phytophthora fragariaefolia TaxID=1490495 RepID=A0A9W6Y1W1_9STRA|nr:unnamed protein product [Phytophthora fragariaefolia]